MSESVEIQVLIKNVKSLLEESLWCYECEVKNDSDNCDLVNLYDTKNRVEKLEELSKKDEPVKFLVHIETVLNDVKVYKVKKCVDIEDDGENDEFQVSEDVLAQAASTAKINDIQLDLENKTVLFNTDENEKVFSLKIESDEEINEKLKNLEPTPDLGVESLVDFLKERLMNKLVKFFVKSDFVYKVEVVEEVENSEPVVSEEVQCEQQVENVEGEKEAEESEDKPVEVKEVEVEPAEQENIEIEELKLEQNEEAAEPEDSNENETKEEPSTETEEKQEETQIEIKEDEENKAEEVIDTTESNDAQ